MLLLRARYYESKSFPYGIVILNEGGYLKDISKKLKLSKTDIHQTIVKFRNPLSLQDLHIMHRSGSPRVTSQRDGNAFSNQFEQENLVGLVATVPLSNQADPIFLNTLPSILSGDHPFGR